MQSVVRLYVYANAFYACTQAYANQYVMLIGMTPLSKSFIKVRVILEGLLRSDAFPQVAEEYPSDFRELVSMGPDEVDTLWEFEHHRLLRFLMAVQEVYILAGEPPLEVTPADKRTLDEAYAAVKQYTKTVTQHWARVLEKVEAGAPEDTPTVGLDTNQPAHSVFNVIQVDQLINSQIQVGSGNSVVSGSWTAEERAALSNFLSEVKGNFERLNLGIAPGRELQADVATIEAQLNATQPKRTVIVECLKSLRNILEGITGSLVASGLLEVAQSLLVRWK